MSAGRAHGEPSTSTKAAADVLVKGLGDMLRAQLTGAERRLFEIFVPHTPRAVLTLALASW